MPGTVLTSLVNDGVYPEPLYGENNRPDKIPESLCRTSYWYRTQFTVPPDYAGNSLAEFRRHQLHGRGLGQRHTIWATFSGAFARGIFDITAVCQARRKRRGRGAHQAAAASRQTPQNKPQPRHGLNGGILSEDGPTFLCTLGWDWIPASATATWASGRRSTLSATGPVVVQDPLVTSPICRCRSTDVPI